MAYMLTGLAKYKLLISERSGERSTVSNET